jgi:sugar phosphate isomerase/epimerase
MNPHVCLPYESLEKYLQFIKKDRLNLEIYFGSRGFDAVQKSDIIELNNKLDYAPELSIHAPFMDLSPAAVDSKVREVTCERFSNILDFAEILGSKVVVFHSGYDKRKYNNNMDIWLKQSLKTWIPLNRKAGALGIKIAIENIFEEDPENLRILAEEMNSGNFGLCFDTGHFNLFSSISLSKWLGMIKPFVIELHLHDNKGYADDHLAIGDGNIDFSSIFKGLEGIDCVYTIESHTIENVKKSMERLKSFFNA